MFELEDYNNSQMIDRRTSDLLRFIVKASAMTVNELNAMQGKPPWTNPYLEIADLSI